MPYKVCMAFFFLKEKTIHYFKWLGFIQLWELINDANNNLGEGGVLRQFTFLQKNVEWLYYIYSLFIFVNDC